MEQNPFAAPASPSVASREASPAAGTQPWFAVGTRKLMVMTVTSLGLYSIHWFERQYRFQKALRGESTMPLARGLFSVFFAKDLFARIEAAAAQAGVRPGWSASATSGVFIASAVLSRVADRVSSKLTEGTVSTAFALLSIAFLWGIAYPLVQVQGTVNELLERSNPGIARNESFTAWNWIVIAVGGSLITLGVVGMLMPGE